MTITLGWWMLFAALPPVLFSALSIVFALDGEDDGVALMLIAAAVTAGCSVLVRYL